MYRHNKFGSLSRRSFLQASGSALAVTALLSSQTNADSVQTPPTAVPFSFESLVQNARQLASQTYTPPAQVGAPFTDLDYDDYRNIRFRERHALWAGPAARAVLHAYHPGWLFDSTVALFDVADGMAQPLRFSSDDFIYGDAALAKIPDGTELPGVAGFRINTPLNSEFQFDETLSFLGASYFRALGAGNRYGLSARGLAVNTAISEPEEFPRFSAFWLERPQPGQTQVTFYALLQSESVAGAYKFALTPGQTTVMDVSVELFFRSDVEQLGVAPLTSMYLFGANDQGGFDDYRPRVHDSEALIVNTDRETLYRVLNNPPQLANSYFAAQSPRSFGLVQRHRSFDDYLDAEARYELRPSLMVEPQGDWGDGTIRLIEIPSDLEGNDNIVAFWTYDRGFKAGDHTSFSYRMHWGSAPAGASSDLARVARTLAGAGGVAGVKPQTDRRKFVIDFEGAVFATLAARDTVSANINITNGTLAGHVLQRVDGHADMWRLVLEVTADGKPAVELRADLVNDERKLTETWTYQWLKE
ncbi:MAG: glucan biosynthesis protein [Sulfitobacter sp.]|uniref:glucan biosynthesis protein n=1 Tax=Sulfitobacter sp. TaxID=1903071 RepID=UPI00405956C1